MQLSNRQLASLPKALRAVPDRRGQRGRRHPLATVLTIMLATRLAGCRTLTEISDFGRALSQEALRRIGSRLRPQTQRCHAPGVSTLNYVLKEVDIDAMERILADWMQAQVPENQAVAIDNKTLRGSYNHDLDADGKPRQGAAQQQPSAVDIGCGVVVGQRGCSGSKDEAEGAALRQGVPALPADTIVLADALHTSRQTGELICGLGQYDAFQGKGNQPTLLETPSEHSWCGRREVRTVDGAHGRETRCVPRREVHSVPPSAQYAPAVRHASRSPTALRPSGASIIARYAQASQGEFQSAGFQTCPAIRLNLAVDSEH